VPKRDLNKKEKDNFSELPYLVGVILHNFEVLR